MSIKNFLTKTETYTDRYGDTHEETIILKHRIIILVVAAIFILSTISGCFAIVPTGYTGVRTTFGQIDEDVVDPGFTWKIPYVQTVEQVNNKQQDITFDDKIWSETSERTAIYFEGVTVTYTISAEKSAWIYANVSNYRKTLVSDNIVASSIKAASKQLISTDATNRGLIEPLAQKTLQESLDTKYGKDVVYINKVVISNIDFEDSYNQAIAEKQEAQLAYEKQQIQNQTSVEKAEAAAKVKVTEAQAEADALRIKAEAEAEANEKVADSLTKGILQKMYYEVWDGKLPTVYGADGNLIEIPVG